jgi:hypothetical protein
MLFPSLLRIPHSALSPMIWVSRTVVRYNPSYVMITFMTFNKRIKQVQRILAGHGLLG